MDEHSKDDLLTIQISALEHWAFCPRQCALIHIEQIFEENVFTIRGRLAHERIDDLETEWREGVRYEYALPLWSERLGLSGKADCVEFHEDGTVYPVERKLGKKRRRRPDDLQLCAQALCLEDMLGLPVERGAIYSVKSRRRREVEFTPELRAETEAAILQVRELLRSGEVPPPAADKRCPDCSLIDVCQPDAIQSLKKGAIVGVLRALFEIEEVPP